LKRWWWFGSAGLVGIVLVVAFGMRVHLLRLAALPLISTDNGKLHRADAILILGGGQDTRTVGAVALYRAGLAPVILLANEEPLPFAGYGLARSGSEIAIEILTGVEQVPPQVIDIIGTSCSIDYASLERMSGRMSWGGLLCELDRFGFVTSTFEEAKALRLWCLANNARSVIIVTNPFHSRRVRWIFTKVLADEIDMQIATVDAHQYTPRNWWESEEGLIALNNEWVKMVYYWIKY